MVAIVNAVQAVCFPDNNKKNQACKLLITKSLKALNFVK